MSDMPTPTPKKVRIILCSWAAAPFQGDEKCGWTGRADKYHAHLVQRHGGKTYKRPRTG